MQRAYAPEGFLTSWTSHCPHFCHKFWPSDFRCPLGYKPGSDSTSTRAGNFVTDEPTTGARSQHSIDESSSPGDRPDATPPFMVAAIGASAGGLEAFSRLVAEIPADAPLALVLVQHLARDQQSLLTEILSPRTALTVVEAQDHMPIRMGHAYIIPADAHMTVSDGQLRVQPRPKGVGGVQVDLLFRSLAEQYREKAVGVVLSGGAADGAAGLCEIKAAGGFTIAQHPDDAREGDMPRAAITAGAADVVLPADEIAAELLRLATLPLFVAAAARDATTDEDLYAEIFRLLRRVTGVDFSHYKRPTVARRIARRMAVVRSKALSDYVARLKEDAREVQQLQEDVLIHVTSFFREPDSFIALKESVFPILLRDRDDSAIRIWVPGCSSGQEVYSLAIALFETLEQRIENFPVQFFGTDVSKTSVEQARAGVYPQAAVADLSPERLGRFFSKVEGGYQIGKSIRERCVFARQDITRDPPFSRLDLIVCRNTLIYLGQPIQRRVMAMMHYALKANGFLALGRAETPGANVELFSTFDKRSKIYRKKPSSAQPEFHFRATPFDPTIAVRAKSDDDLPPLRKLGRPGDVQAEANRAALERYAPPAVVVDSNFRIVTARGATGPFLELPMGEVSLDALKMVRPGLLLALRSALQDARDTRTAVRREGLRTLSENEGYLVNIEVIPLSGLEAPHFLISFERVVEEARSVETSESPQAASSDAAFERTIGQLRWELGATREQLHTNFHDLAAANEELQSANEEILSSNEELQSTNEELDTAKEELQSTNEELSTLNEELHGRNEQLSLANSDLANLLASVQIPILMIAKDLTIRRFTPAAQRVLNLIPSDVGRPIQHIKSNISSFDFDDPVAEVIETMVAYEREVSDLDGRTYLLRIRPYRSIDDRVDGAVLALFDITATKDALTIAKRTGDAVVASVREPILLLDAESRVMRVNPAFCALFSSDAKATEGRLLYELAGSRWNIPPLRRLLEEILPERKNFEAFPVELQLADGKPRKLLLDGRRIESDRSEAGVILLVIRLESDV
jgi:two-component system CheB/CheR fusion protein